MDAQSSVADIEPLVALIQSYARAVLEGTCRPGAMGPEVQDENAFIAARDGMEALLIEPRERRLVPVRELLESLLRECRPHAVALGCARELEAVRRLAARNGAVRQRALRSAGASLGTLVAGLAAQF